MRKDCMKEEAPPPHPKKTSLATSMCIKHIQHENSIYSLIRSGIVV